MTKVKPEEIIAHLRHEFRTALEVTIRESLPGASFEPGQLFQAFCRNVRLSCDEWEVVPDELVQVNTSGDG